MKGWKAIVSAVLVTIVAVGQIVLSIVLYNRHGSSIVTNIGWGILWISAVFGWLPIHTFRKWGGVTKGQSYMQTTTVVDRGIYRIVRHPQYVAGMLIAVALTLVAQHWLVGVLGAVAIIIYYLGTLEADRSCVEKFGEPYEKYMRSVPRVNAMLGIIRCARNRPAP